MDGTFLRARAAPPPWFVLQTSRGARADTGRVTFGATGAAAGFDAGRLYFISYPQDASNTPKAGVSTRAAYSTMRENDSMMPNALDKPSGRIAGGASPSPAGAYSVYDIRIASQRTSCPRATVRTGAVRLACCATGVLRGAAHSLRTVAQQILVLHARRATETDTMHGFHGHLLLTGTGSAHLGRRQ